MTNEQTLNSQPQVAVEGLAVIDLGSASTRMLLVNAEGVSSKYQATTAMAESLSSSGTISIDALNRVQDVLCTFRDRCAEHSITNVTVVATAAARMATNVDELASLVDSIFGIALRVLTPEDEGSLAFAGATSGLPEDTMVMLVDIGGASTEFVVGVTGTSQASVVSVPMGAVSMSESYIVSDPPDPGGLSSALSVASTHVDDVIRSLPTIPNAAAHGVVVGVGGTITTTAAVEIGMPVYDVKKIQDFVLHKDAAEDVFRALATESHADRAFNPGLEADRVPYIVGGLCVLIATMRHLVIDEIMVSDRDLLDGLKMEVLAR